MPRLGDFLGLLLAEVSTARLQADLEAIRIAELYASHPLLKSLPVPRVRLPDVTVNVPLLIAEVDEPPADGSPRGSVPKPLRSERLLEVLGRHLNQAGVALTAAEQRRLQDAVEETPATTDVPAEVDVDTTRIADRFVDDAMRTIDELRSPESVSRPRLTPADVEALRSAVRLELLAIRSAPPRLNVIVSASEMVAAAAAPGQVTHLQLKIVEQGLEWTTIQSEAGERTRLVPE